MSPHLQLAVEWVQGHGQAVSSAAGCLGTPLDNAGLGTPTAIKMPGRSREDKVAEEVPIFILLPPENTALISAHFEPKLQHN